jgi:protocatechuate 3,4-dioxygenase beta subunit
MATQLYFPGEPANDRDGIFDPELLMDVKEKGDAKEATFDFVLRIV